MPTHKVKVTQVFRTERVITIDVEADSLESAIEQVDSGSVYLPDHDDPRWVTGWDLQSEQVIGVKSSRNKKRAGRR